MSCEHVRDVHGAQYIPDYSTLTSHNILSSLLYFKNIFLGRWAYVLYTTVARLKLLSSVLFSPLHYSYFFLYRAFKPALLPFYLRTKLELKLSNKSFKTLIHLRMKILLTPLNTSDSKSVFTTYFTIGYCEKSTKALGLCDTAEYICQILALPTILRKWLLR